MQIITQHATTTLVGVEPFWGIGTFSGISWKLQ